MRKPAAYWRSTKEWHTWLGRKGVVVASTVVRVTAPHLSSFAPYSYVVVEFGSERREYMGADHQQLYPGDEVVCVLRRMCLPEKDELIPYGIKVAKSS